MLVVNASDGNSYAVVCNANFVETESRLGVLEAADVTTAGQIAALQAADVALQARASTLEDAIHAPVADLTALAAIVTTPLVDGTLIYVIDPGDFYLLDKTNSHTPETPTVVAGSGGGYWLSRLAGRWDDLQGDISQGTAGAALTYEAFRDTPFKMNFFRHNQPDELHMRYQLSHRWLNNVSYIVRPHLHIVPMVAPSSSPQTVGIVGQYVWAQRNGLVPADASWTDLAATQSIATADAFKHISMTLADITPPANPQVSDILLIYVKRDVGATDTYTTNKSGGTVSANLGLLSLDVHIRAVRHGTPTI